MAKVSTVDLKFNGKARRFEVHYSPKGTEFYVKLPPEVTAIVKTNPCRDTQKEAEDTAQEILHEYVKATNTRRKVILCRVYEPRAGSHSFNGEPMSPRGMTLSYNIMDEITAGDGTKEYVGTQKRAVYMTGDETHVIEWTQEREDFFAELLARLDAANSSLKKFLREAMERPQICSFERLKTLMSGEEKKP